MYNMQKKAQLANQKKGLKGNNTINALTLRIKLILRYSS